MTFWKRFFDRFGEILLQDDFSNFAMVMIFRICGGHQISFFEKFGELQYALHEIWVTDILDLRHGFLQFFASKSAVQTKKTLRDLICLQLSRARLVIAALHLYTGQRARQILYNTFLQRPYQYLIGISSSRIFKAFKTL